MFQFKRIFNSVACLLRKKSQNKKEISNVLLGKGAYLDPSVKFVNGNTCFLTLGDNAYVGKDVDFDISCYNISIGDGTTIHESCTIYGDVAIGASCLISKRLFVSSGSHEINRPCYIRYNDILEAHDYSSKAVRIHDDVWIGCNVFLKSGIVIAKGSVIGACSAVTKDVPPYTIVGGVPAKKIRSRYDYDPPEIIRSENESHFPYFYSGFDQGNLEKTDIGYLVKKQHFIISVPNQLQSGSVIIKGNSGGSGAIKIVGKNNAVTFSKGEYECSLELLDDDYVTMFGKCKFLELEINCNNLEFRIKNITYNAN